jgi:pimeloyl-ACP methyl ester carboxylesterase
MEMGRCSKIAVGIVVAIALASVSSQLAAAQPMVKAFSQDVQDNLTPQRTKLTMPVLAVVGEKSFGATEAILMRNVAVNVREAVAPHSGHWLMEESPAYTVALIRDFSKDPLPATR